ncbi:MAG: HTH domain-containing protein [Treponema phagedenis]|uniref:helix-turn-helix transcriptional regulator n=1 Tax=Treponema phagedenis TaxID=162 RepID=UPI0031341D5A
MDKKEGRLRFWRILQLDEVIRTKKYPTLKTLVQVLGVSARTVQRDIEFLRDMYNAPIEYDHTRRGYFYTENTFFLKSVFLNEEEFFLLQFLKNFCVNTAIRRLKNFYKMYLKKYFR